MNGRGVSPASWLRERSMGERSCGLESGAAISLVLDADLSKSTCNPRVCQTIS